MISEFIPNAHRINIKSLDSPHKHRFANACAREGVLIHKEVWDNKIQIHQQDLTAGFHTLLQDGHIEEVAKGYSSIPLGAITGKGRVFHEQGGYKDQTPRLDKMIKWAKNNKFIAWLILIVIIGTSIIGILVSLITIYQFFSK